VLERDFIERRNAEKEAAVDAPATEAFPTDQGSMALQSK
jgi:hypothetical protein